MIGDAIKRWRLAVAPWDSRLRAAAHLGKFLTLFASVVKQYVLLLVYMLYDCEDKPRASRKVTAGL